MTICNCILDCMAQINAIEIDRSSHQNLFLKMQRLLYGAAVGLAAYYKRICISDLAVNESKRRSTRHNWEAGEMYLSIEMFHAKCPATALTNPGTGTQAHQHKAAHCDRHRSARSERNSAIIAELKGDATGSQHQHSIKWPARYWGPFCTPTDSKRIIFLHTSQHLLSRPRPRVFHRN